MLYQIIIAILALSAVYFICCGLRRAVQKSLIAIAPVDAKSNEKYPYRPYPENYPGFYNPKAGKLPYVYYDFPVKQISRSIKYVSPYLGIEQEIKYRPRHESGKNFDNVKGIAVSENLTLLREIVISDLFPGDVRKLIKHFSGRLPTEDELRQIFEKRAMICNNLLECGEPLLRSARYLYTCGNEQEDRDYNYCLHFATGDDVLADCDSYVCAILVE